MFPHASSELIAFPPEAAEGPAAESPNAAGLVLSPGPPPRVFDVDGYGASAGGDATEVRNLPLDSAALLFEFSI
jgi:hypothetical protein